MFVDTILILDDDTANLQGIAFVRTEFEESDLQGAILAGADLTGANLMHTNLTETDFRHATLVGAILTAADLRGAVTATNLSIARLLPWYLSR